MWFRRERDPLEQRLGHRFRDPGLLALAFAHRSGANEEGLPENNERLEFVGDAVLGLVAADWLFRRYPDRPEGDLSRRKAQLVSELPLAEHARTLELGERVRLGVGEERSGGRDKASILADTLEAVFGALWLDGGMEAARPAIERYLEAADRGGATGKSPDPKTALQELLQARGEPLPVYEIVEEIGPDHDKRFVCEVAISGRPAGRGEGRSKKDAQQQAATAALDRLESTEAADADLPSGAAGLEKAP